MKHPKNELFAVAHGDRFVNIKLKGQRWSHQFVTVSLEAAERTADCEVNQHCGGTLTIYRLTPVKSYKTTVTVEEHEVDEE